MTSPSEPLRLEHPEQLPDRRPLDKYRTPEWATGALIESFPKLGAELLIDPCAGDCRMPRQLMAAGRFVQCVTNDIDPTESTHYHGDLADSALWDFGVVESVGCVTNPSFLEATRLALHALEVLSRRRHWFLALLLRSTWLEPAKDRQWLGRMPPRAMLVLPRFSFIGGGSDQAGCHWMLWGDVEPGIKVWTGKPGQLQLLGGGQ